MRILILLLAIASQCFGAYGYRKSITVGASVVTSGPHADYRMLISDTDSALATVANGGRVQHASGYDIAYFTNSDCSTGQIAYKRISWNATTGAVIHKVYVNNINNNAVIYRCYGDASISTDQQNSAGVYVSSVGGAWGLDDNAANTTVADGTGNTATGTSAANTSTKTVTAKISSGLTFNGTSDVVTVSNNSTLNASTGLTISMWTKKLRNGSYDWLIAKSNTANTHFVYGAEWNTSNKIEFIVSDGTAGFSNVKQCIGATSVTSTSAYQHIVVTYDGGTNTAVVYLNGAQDASGQPGAASGCNSVGSTYSGNLVSSTGELRIGGIRYDSLYYYANVEEDDVEVENVVRSAGWVATEYANENSPGTFYTVGSEVALSSISPRRRVIIQ